MRLKYLKGKEITISERRRIGGVSSPYTFNPYGIVPDYVGDRILRNPRYDGMFERASLGEFICEQCGKDFPHQGALNLHYSYHIRKEKERLKNEKITLDADTVDGIAIDGGRTVQD